MGGGEGKGKATQPEFIDELVRRRFESGWIGARPEAIETVLSTPEDPRYLGTLEESVHIELEFAWRFRAGLPGGKPSPYATPPSVEQYLQRFPALSESGILARLIGQEFFVRQRYADRPSTQEYQARFPDLLSNPTRLRRLARPAGGASLPEIPGYDVQSELGRGGMGVVYRARQIDLNRPVAIKMLRSGAHAGEDERIRFHTEAEAVAQLGHPHIVEIYEIGDVDGSPYLTLEFLEGGTLADSVAAGPLPPLEAAATVRTLAVAVDIAHRQGILHRDLKPANVLLTSDGTPKISDFGLARRLDSGAPQTRTGDILGTPSYMAPEQARGHQADVGVGIDIYALGAILYELLTSRPPFLAETALETLAQVTECEPLPPDRLQPRVPRDLVVICMKCLEKDPARRYGSAVLLGDDIGRFLAGEPVFAQPAGVLRRGAKWVKRRPALAAVITISSVAAVVVLLGSLWYNHQLSESLARESSLRVQAEESFVEARSAVDRMLTRVGSGPLVDVPHMKPVAQKLLEDALEFYKGFLGQRGSEPAVRRETARAYRRVGDIRRKLGQVADAQASFEEAVGLLEALILEYPEVGTYQHDLADTHNNRALLLDDAGQPEEAIAALQEAVRLRELQITRAARQPTDSFRLAESYHNLGTFYLDRHRVEDAESILGKAASVYEALAPVVGHNAEFQNQLARTYANLGQLLRLAKRPVEAREKLLQAVALKEKLLEGYPEKTAYREDLGSTYNSLGLLLVSLKEPLEAERVYAKAVALQRRLATDFPSVPAYRTGLGGTLHNLAEIHLQRGERVEAQRLLVEAIRSQLEALKHNARNPDARRYAYNHHWALAETYTGLKKHVEAAQVSAGLLEFLPSGWPPLHLAAGLFAQCAGLVQQDSEGDAAEREQLEQAYGDHAIAWLRKAIDAGYRGAWALYTETEFQALRGRKDFQEILLEAMKFKDKK
jgi:serine/threonine protein kinase